MRIPKRADQDRMKLIFALLLSFSVYAENSNGNPSEHNHFSSVHHIGTSSGPISSESMANSASEGGQATATGGSAVGEGGNAEGGTSIGGDVSINEKRSAPSVYAPSIQSTTPYLKCAPFGGSGVDGGIAFGWCWIQRDAWGIRTFTELRALGLYRAASEARCGTRLLARPFGGVDSCKKAILEALEKPRETSKEVMPNAVDGSTNDSRVGGRESEYEVASGPLIADVDAEQYEALESLVERMRADIAAMRVKDQQEQKRAQRAAQKPSYNERLKEEIRKIERVSIKEVADG